MPSPTATRPPASSDAHAGRAAAAPGSAQSPRARRNPAGPSRREFLKLGTGVAAFGALTSLGTASMAFLWPNLRAGFGATFDVGSEAEVLANIDANQNRWEFPEGRTMFVRYDASLDPHGQYADLTGGAQVMALYWKCVHLGCKVPWCASSQWWECPCHGSRYNRWGEYQAGPAPRGLDRFEVRTDGGRLLLNTSAVITGPPRGGGVLNQPQEGPSCV